MRRTARPSPLPSPRRTGEREGAARILGFGSEADMVRLMRAQVREIDRRASEDYHIPSIVLMENAARSVVDVARGMLRREGIRSALILCGGGNNGGDGLAIARHLYNRGTPVFIGLTI